MVAVVSVVGIVIVLCVIVHDDRGMVYVGKSDDICYPMIDIFLPVRGL